MLEQYGDFAETISTLKSDLTNVRVVWSDQTALTYDSFNDNTEFCVEKIWDSYSNAVSAHNLVKSNYDESENDSILSQLNAKIESV